MSVSSERFPSHWLRLDSGTAKSRPAPNLDSHETSHGKSFIDRKEK